MDDYLLHADRITVGYDGVPLLREVELHVKKGEILTLIGPNGAGKSTVLKSLVRQLELLGGRVYLSGRPMDEMSGRQVARSLSVLLTGRVRTEWMTCGDVAAAGRYPYTGRLGLLTDEDRRQVREAMALVHALDLFDRDFARVSDGQRQRVLLARALCQQPDVLVLDEPTSFLDIRYKAELLTVLKELVRERQLAVVLSLHELDLAHKVSDRVLCIRGDRVDRCGTPDEVFSGGYIEQLYGMTRGSYNEVYGCVELERPQGAPQVFVIGGGGSGLPAYRQCQRQGVPFAAGILHENDIDYPVARALAAQVVAEQAFQPIRSATVAQAQQVLRGCARVLCCVPRFGALNRANEQLLEAAAAQGIPVERPHRSEG
ncbi:MAG: ABC transporter ATP-binding protein [Eubacteriales bacterium]|nr:ABC transporter ATP-binding protein [Eubacteriales bacterium]